MRSDRKARISGLAGTEHARNRISLPYDRGRSGYEIREIQELLRLQWEVVETTATSALPLRFERCISATSEPNDWDLQVTKLQQE